MNESTDVKLWVYKHALLPVKSFYIGWVWSRHWRSLRNSGFLCSLLLNMRNLWILLFWYVFKKNSILCLAETQRISSLICSHSHFCYNFFSYPIWKKILHISHFSSMLEKMWSMNLHKARRILQKDPMKLHAYSLTVFRYNV